MKLHADDYDTHWKEILECFFPEFVGFFFPKIADHTDWEKGYEFLEQELRQVRDAELGRRYADKLVRLWRKNGDEAWVLVHVEIQSQEEAGFAERMFVYNQCRFLKRIFAGMARSYAYFPKYSFPGLL